MNLPEAVLFVLKVWGFLAAIFAIAAAIVLLLPHWALVPLLLVIVFALSVLIVMDE